MHQHRSPGLLRQLAAMLYDAFLVLPVIMAAVAVATLVTVSLGSGAGRDYSATLPPLLVQTICVVCVVLFYGYFWRMKGQSLGMQAWRIRLRSLQGERITYKQVLLRCLGACLSMGCLGLGYLWCLVDRRGRRWHDYLSGTELELLPKRKKREGNGDTENSEAANGSRSSPLQRVFPDSDRRHGRDASLRLTQSIVPARGATHFYHRIHNFTR